MVAFGLLKSSNQRVDGSKFFFHFCFYSEQGHPQLWYGSENWSDYVNDRGKYWKVPLGPLGRSKGNAECVYQCGLQTTDDWVIVVVILLYFL